MNKIILMIGIVMILFISGCAKDCSKEGSCGDLDYLENTTIIPVYRCHIMCMVTLYNTTNVYTVDNECCSFYKDIISINNLITDEDMSFPFIEGYKHIWAYGK